MVNIVLLYKIYYNDIKTGVGFMSFNNKNHRELFECILSYVVDKECAIEIIKNVVSKSNITFAEAIDSIVDCCEINNIGDKEITFFKLFRCAAKVYLKTSFLKMNGNRFDNIKKLCDYFELSFLGIYNEEIHIIGLDDELHITCEGVIGLGNPAKVELPLRQFAEFIIKNHLSRIVISHNHPNGSFMPSNEDVYCTKKLIEFLMMIDTELIDHIVVGRGGTYSMRSSLKGYEIWNDA